MIEINAKNEKSKLLSKFNKKETLNICKNFFYINKEFILDNKDNIEYYYTTLNPFLSLKIKNNLYALGSFKTENDLEFKTYSSVK